MKRFIVVIISLMLFSVSGISQDTIAPEKKLYPVNNDTVLPVDTVKGVIKTDVKGKLNIKKDERIDKVSEEMSGGEFNNPKIRGYRVQIKSSSTKSIADGAKGAFVKLYPSHKAYTDYKPPNFRIRVGNFRTKLDAEKFQNEIIGSFPNSLIVVDWIDLPNLD